MSTANKKVLFYIVAVIVGFFALKLVLGFAMSLLWSILPFAIVGGVVYALYFAYGRKALGGGRRTLP